MRDTRVAEQVMRDEQTRRKRGVLDPSEETSQSHVRSIAPTGTADAELRADLLSEVHATRLAGHFGVRKMHAAVSGRYWWPMWHADVEAYVKECDACQRNNTSTRTHTRART